MTRLLLRIAAAGLLAALLGPAPAEAQSPRVEQQLQQFDTDLDRHSIDLDELRAGGPPKDGIPSIDNPSFVTPGSASDWIAPEEPVIALEVSGTAKAYPLQILTHHEIVNDRIGGVPVAVTFCPLCYSAITFRRVLDGEPVELGVSGLLRKSDLVMYDRTTETLWQQLNGQAIVGDRTGQQLERLPSQIISFAQFRAAYPNGQVLSRDTGHNRPYGQNPYAGYDDIDKKPFLYNGPENGKLPPMEKVVALTVDGTAKAYPHRVTKEQRVIHDTVGNQPLVVFHGSGAVSALDERQIRASKEVGSTGVFDPRAEGQRLRFRYEDGQFVDEQTGSTWTITGRAVSGPLEGTQLKRLSHGDYFAFAWFAFQPETQLYAAQ